MADSYKTSEKISNTANDQPGATKRSWQSPKLTILDIPNSTFGGPNPHPHKEDTKRSTS